MVTLLKDKPHAKGKSKHSNDVSVLSGSKYLIGDQLKNAPALLSNTPWVESPFFDELIKTVELDDDMRQLCIDYNRDGYVVLDIGLPGFQKMADAIINNLKDKYNGNVRIQDAWALDSNVKAIALAPKMMEVLSVLYARRPIPFQTLNFHVGTQQKTHSDTIHFHCTPARFMCGVWVALEDTDTHNGPLHYYPGSHKLPLFDMHDLGYMGSTDQDYHDYPAYEDYVEKLMKHAGLERKELHVKAGQALIWAANLFHGGCPITQEGRSRHSQVTHYYFEGCMYYTPRLSDPFMGKIAFRDIYDISQGREAQQYYLGQPVSPKTVDTGGYFS
jgi:hypothetical protein